MSTVPIIESEGDKLLARMVQCVEDMGAAMNNAVEGSMRFTTASDIDRFILSGDVATAGVFAVGVGSGDDRSQKSDCSLSQFQLRHFRLPV